MYIIAKEFSFSASHQLMQLPDSHPCARLHGHNYTVQLILRSKELCANNFVKDFRSLDFFKTYIDNEVDHRHLNDVFNSGQVTSEFLAQQFYLIVKKQLPELYAVRVSETPKSWAEYNEES